MCLADARDGLAHEFSNFVTIEIGSYAWSQVTMLQGKLAFSDFRHFAAIAANVITYHFLLGKRDLLFS